MLPSKIQSALSYCEGKNVYEIMEDNNIELLSIPLVIISRSSTT